MGLFDIFSRGKDDSESSSGRSPARGESFDKWIQSHLAWKNKLSAILDGGGETLDEHSLAKDTHCDLGAWIYRDGISAYAGSQTFQSLRHEHAKFHQCASEVVMLFKMGKVDEARMLLELRFEHESDSVVALLNKLEKESSKRH